MNAAAALVRLQRLVQSDVEPTLSSAELDDLLSLAAVVDEDGNQPDADDWTPTYAAMWLNSAAAEGWRTKAAKLGAGETFSSDGASFDPETRRKFCQEQARLYDNKVAGTVRVPGRTATVDTLVDPTVSVVFN